MSRSGTSTTTGAPLAAAVTRCAVPAVYPPRPPRADLRYCAVHPPVAESRLPSSVVAGCLSSELYSSLIARRQTGYLPAFLALVVAPDHPQPHADSSHGLPPTVSCPLHLLAVPPLSACEY